MKTVNRIKKSLVDQAIRSGGAPPAVPGVSSEHMAVLVLHAYHPAMQKNDPDGAKTAMARALADYQAGRLKIKRQWGAYHILQE